MPRCVIFTAGDQHGIEKHEIGLRHDDFVICCDAGYRLAQRLGVRPDLLLGDFRLLYRRTARGYSGAAVHP